MKPILPKQLKRAKRRCRIGCGNGGGTRSSSFLVTHVNDILQSIFANYEVYTINQNIYNANGLYAHISHIPNIFEEPCSEYKGVLYSEGYDYDELLDEVMEAPSSDLCSQGE